MVGVAQLVSAPDCGSGGRGFESLHPPQRKFSGSDVLSGPTNFPLVLGCSQVVRQGTLTPSLAGSSPAIPAKVYPEGRTGMIGCLPSCENKPSAPLAQSVEHLPFKQGVRGSNPRRGTKKSSTAKRGFSFWCLPVFAVQKPGPQAAFD